MAEENRPEYGKQYSLTGGHGQPCIANGNSWKESEVKKEVAEEEVEEEVEEEEDEYNPENYAGIEDYHEEEYREYISNKHKV